MCRGKLGLGNIGSVLKSRDVSIIRRKSSIITNLVSLVGSSGSDLALLAGRKLSQVAVVITFPALRQTALVNAQLVVWSDGTDY